MRRSNSTVFASAKGRQSRQPTGGSRELGRYRRRGSCVTHRARADHDDDEVLAPASCAHTAQPHVSPTAIRNAGSPIIRTDSMMIVATLELRRHRRRSATDGSARSCVFIPASRTRTRRQVAGHSPSTLCPIVASCIVIIHNKKRWRKWAERCPARQYS
jgi:hypothetical protein